MSVPGNSTVLDAKMVGGELLNSGSCADLSGNRTQAFEITLVCVRSFRQESVDISQGTVEVSGGLIQRL